MSFNYAHKGGGLNKIQDLNGTNSVIHKMNVVATGSLTVYNTTNGSTSTEYLTVEFIGQNVTGQTKKYIPIGLYRGTGLPHLPSTTFGTGLDGLLWEDTLTNSLYRLVASSATIATGSHVQVGGGGDAVLGDAEDGDYTDGLFTDITSTTPLGTFADRVNEVLSSLYPAPAPALDDVDCDDTGDTGKLSFGASNSTVTGYTNVNTNAGFSATNVDELYTTTNSGNNLRRGIFDGSTTIEGTLNEDVTADGTNYEADSFGNADQGTLKLEVNGSVIHSVDLTSFGSGNSLGANGSGFVSLTAATNGEFTNGDPATLFKHRTGTWRVHPDDQRAGWNYMRLIHTISGDTSTNYVEWVNDPSGSAQAVSASHDALQNVSMSGTRYISGVKYYTGGKAQYSASLHNVYVGTYDNGSSAISFNETNLQSVTNRSYPPLGAGDHTTKVVYVTQSVDFSTNTKILNSSVSLSVTALKPNRSNYTSVTRTISGIFYNNESASATDLTEDFVLETYRCKEAAFGNQADVPTSGTGDTYSFDDGSGNLGNVDLTTELGLLVYNNELMSPKSSRTPSTGDFTGFSNGPASNKDYSGVSSSTEFTFYRRFKNTSGGTVFSFTLNINGSGTLIEAADSLTGNSFKCAFKLPTNGSGFATGWMDAGAAFDGTNVTDGSGGVSGAIDTSLNLTNTLTTGTQGILANDYVIVRITARGDWTGYITGMTVSF